MKRIPIKSSSIKSIGYDIESEILEVEFIRGDIYKYYEVIPKIFCNLLFADSIGSYFYKNIAKKFEFEKLEREIDE